MASRNCSRYSILKLEELIRDHVNKKNSAAKVELANMVVDGEDLIDALDNFDLETEKETEENNRLKVDYEEKCKNYTKLEEKYKKLEEAYNKLEEGYNENLSQDIRRLIEGKEGSFIDKIRKILEE